MVNTQQNILEQYRPHCLHLQHHTLAAIIAIRENPPIIETAMIIFRILSLIPSGGPFV